MTRALAGLWSAFLGDSDFEHPWDNFNALISPLGRGLRFLLYANGNEYIQPFAEPALMISDIVLGAGSYATQYGATFADWQSSLSAKQALSPRPA